jgi:signal transduction histidine kinase
MATHQVALLPVHDFQARLHEWRQEPSDDALHSLCESFDRVLNAYGVNGALLTVDAPPLPRLVVAAGSLSAGESASAQGRERSLDIGAAGNAKATLRVDGSDSPGLEQLTSALELSLAAVWAQRRVLDQQRQLEALDVAVRGIATIGPVERVLQVIVDRVRELVGAEYAALGIVGSFGRIDQFLTSGISSELRARLGPPPQGHGLLGIIIREDRSLLIDDIETHPQRYGFPDHHPEMHSLLGVPVRSKGRTIGNLYLTNKITAPTFDEDDLRLVERFALHAGIAIENARLHDEVGRLAIVEERQRISQDLHDSIIQSLYAISLSLEDLPEVIVEDPGDGAARADRAIDSIHGVIRDIRNFIMGLQPELVAEGDLVTGIQTLGAEFEANTLIDLEVNVDPRLVEQPRELAAQIIAITREALSNIARHSAATRATLELDEMDDSVLLVIGDNGRGFDVDADRSNRQRGLTNLHARAAAVGGTLKLTSEPGSGTRLELLIPTE